MWFSKHQKHTKSQNLLLIQSETKSRFPTKIFVLIYIWGGAACEWFCDVSFSILTFTQLFDRLKIFVCVCDISLILHDANYQKLLATTLQRIIVIKKLRKGNSNSIRITRIPFIHFHHQIKVRPWCFEILWSHQGWDKQIKIWNFFKTIVLHLISWCA